MSGKFQTFVKTPKGKLTVALAVLGVTWTVLLLHFAGGLKDVAPTAEKIRNANRDLKRKELAWNSARAEKAEADAVKDKFNAIVRDAWHENKHGMVDTVLRQMISGVAQNQMFKLNSLGSVKTSRINKDFYFAELDVSFQAPYPDALKFLAAIQKLQPQVFWKRFDMRPDFRSLRMMNQNATSIAGMVAKNSGESMQNAITVNFSGTIRVIGFDGDPAILKNAELKK